MLVRTHIAFSILIILLFIPHIQFVNDWIFIGVLLLATLLPDIDSGFSTINEVTRLKFFKYLTKHRGVIHSFTVCVIITILLAFFIPTISLAFFLGYASHLFADSFTVEGIKPFWPFDVKSHWRFKTGSVTETSLFVFLLFFDLLFFIFIIT
ncbi:MAG: metal-dependent hydrolase [archaeon]